MQKQLTDMLQSFTIFHLTIFGVNMTSAGVRPTNQDELDKIIDLLKQLPAASAAQCEVIDTGILRCQSAIEKRLKELDVRLNVLLKTSAQKIERADLLRELKFFLIETNPLLEKLEKIANYIDDLIYEQKDTKITDSDLQNRKELIYIGLRMASTDQLDDFQEFQSSVRGMIDYITTPQEKKKAKESEVSTETNERKDVSNSHLPNISSSVRKV